MSKTHVYNGRALPQKTINNLLLFFIINPIFSKQFKSQIEYSAQKIKQEKERKIIDWFLLTMLLLPPLRWHQCLFDQLNLSKHF